MKRMILVLAILALTVPAMAEVKVYCGDQVWAGSSAAEPGWAGVTVADTYVANQPWTADPNLVTVYYDASSEANNVRAFALNVELVDTYGADDAVIESVQGYFVGECNAVDRGYGIFPGTIQIDASGNVTDDGTPVAPNDTPGAVNTGLGTKKIVVEMGSLYTDANVPADHGVLFQFRVNNKACSVVITQNTERGGIVMENPDEAVTVSTPGALVMCPGDITARRDGVWDGKCDTYDFMKAKAQLIAGTYTFMPADITARRNGPPDNKADTYDFMMAKAGLLAGTNWQ